MVFKFFQQQNCFNIKHIFRYYVDSGSRAICNCPGTWVYVVPKHLFYIKTININTNIVNFFLKNKLKNKMVIVVMKKEQKIIWLSECNSITIEFILKKYKQKKK